MDSGSHPPTDRLRRHYLLQQEAKAQRRLQRDIVRDYRAEIIGLIRDDGAKIDDVIATVVAEGEPVLEDGFRAEVRAQIGTVKAIRAGKVSAALDDGGVSASAVPTSELATTLASDLDEDFVGRRRRT